MTNQSSSTSKMKNPSKFFSNSLLKPLIFTIFLFLIPSKSPVFIKPSIFTTMWELLRLVFVGVAVSYGLFSRKNDNPNRENNSKVTNAQSFMPRFLQSLSLFDEEIVNPSNDINKIQVFSSKYYRNQPNIVVAKKGNFIFDKSEIVEKPLLLPVRSLKSSVLDENDDKLGNEEDFSDFSEKVLVENEDQNSFVDEGPDVDKKADEFIAKFREQIKLQRVESVRRSFVHR